MKVINCTPHAIKVNSGITFQPSGNIARVSAAFAATKSITNADVTCECDECLNGGGCGHWLQSSQIPAFAQTFGAIVGLPEAQEGVIYLVSGLVLEAAMKQGRTDVYAPATGHPDTIRNDKGHIISVPGFIGGDSA